MLRYTPSKELKCRIEEAIETGNLDKLLGEFFKSQFNKMIFLKHWEEVTYFSKEPIQNIPVKGTLFPVACFDVEKVVWEIEK